MVSIGNPVQGRIYPKGTAVGAGQFVVTATFGQIDASHPTPHQGIDIGDGKCGSPIIAVEDGVVTAAFVDPAGPLIVRYRLNKYPAYEAALAHMPNLEVSVGQAVSKGQVLGHIGTSGASACHLHGGMKLNGVEIDWWPLLAQNQEEPMPGFKIGTNIGTFKMVGAHALISPSDTKVRYMQPADAGPWDVAASLDLKQPDGTPVDIDGKSPPLNKRDQVYLVDAPTFGVAAYALRQDGAFTPKPTSGHTDEELIKATKTAGYNAAQDVAAMSVATAAKYPKP